MECRASESAASDVLTALVCKVPNPRYFVASARVERDRCGDNFGCDAACGKHRRQCRTGFLYWIKTHRNVGVRPNVANNRRDAAGWRWARMK